MRRFLFILVLQVIALAGLGPELVVNGDFGLEAQGWTIGGAGWDLGEANATYYDNSGTWGFVYQYFNGAVEANKRYRLSFDVETFETPLEAAGVMIIDTGVDTNFHLEITGVGHYEADFETTQVPASITIQARSTTQDYGEVIVDNVSIRQVATTGDFDVDGEVGLADLLMMAEHWLDTTAAYDLDESGRVDWADFGMFAKLWMDGHVNQPPVAVPGAAAVTAGQLVTITLQGTDPENHALVYSIVNPPTKGKLHQLTPGVFRYLAYPGSSGEDVFSYVVNDGALTSEPAIVTVTIAVPSLDTLQFGARSRLVIGDGTNVNIDDAFVLTFWFRTRWPHGVLLSKRHASGPGLVITLEEGCVITTVWDQAGVGYRIPTWSRVDDGQWWFYGLNLNPASEDYNIELMISGDAEREFGSFTTAANVPGIDLSNTAPLLVGTYGNGMFYGSIDYVANSAAGTGILGLAGAVIETRKGDVNPFSPPYYRRFLINEGTGDKTYDVAAEVEGQLSNHNRIKWSTADAPVDERGDQRSRLRGVDGAEMRPDFRRRR